MEEGPDDGVRVGHRVASDVVDVQCAFLLQPLRKESNLHRGDHPTRVGIRGDVLVLAEGTGETA